MKLDESDFRLVMEDLGGKEKPQYQFEGGRLLDKPRRRKSILWGPDSWITMGVCFHGRFLQWPCRLCEFEVPRLQ